MTARTRLPNRRACEHINFTCNGLNYTASIGRFPDSGQIAEIFISSCKAGSHSDAVAKDAVVTCSLALQHSVDVNTIRRALLRDARGVASSPLGTVLDIIAGSAP
jgi:ribonucleoside-diphosphate reductase alpha chain